MPIIRIFTGWDAREAVGWHAFTQSVIEQATLPVSFTPLGSKATERDGTNAFTYSRFLVPHLCGFKGLAIFADGADMLCRSDIAELIQFCDPAHAVFVAKHDYRTKHHRKYVGTEMESSNDDYPRKNWSSMVLWNCGHPSNRCLTPEYVAAHNGAHLHRFAWLDDSLIGDLPKEWNWLADEYGVNDAARLLHWTAGQPGFYHYKDSPHSEEWRASVRGVMKGMD